MNCTKATITKKYEEELDLTPVEARESLEELLEIMKSSLESGEEILISGFGKFQVKEKAPRKGRNPLYQLIFPSCHRRICLVKRR